MSIIVKVKARERYSASVPIFVTEGECYTISVSKKQIWIDWFYKSSPDGFWNPLLLLSGRRVKKVKCFCLCGTIGKDENNHFKIGSGDSEHIMNASGQLFFFANDAMDYYGNNKGEIEVKVTKC